MDPDRQQRDREEVIEQHEWLADDASQEPDRPIDTLAAALKVSEAAKL